jgi:hypothetical protein
MPADPVSRPPRKSRISIRGLMVLVLVTGAALGLIARTDRYLRNARDAVAAIQNAGGRATYETAGHIRAELDFTPFSDSGLAELKALTGISVLNLNGTKVTDAGLAHVKGLFNLAELNLAGTQVTDAGFAHLKGLTNLSIVNVVNTKVTEAGMNALKKARPGLRIYR